MYRFYNSERTVAGIDIKDDRHPLVFGDVLVDDCQLHTNSCALTPECLLNMDPERNNSAYYLTKRKEPFKRTELPGERPDCNNQLNVASTLQGLAVGTTGIDLIRCSRKWKTTKPPAD
jgi:hypothetical protein